jgi:polygalacturonase
MLIRSSLWTAAIFLGGLAFAGQPPTPLRAGICDVRAFGAVGDGKQIDTNAINAAIRSCAGAGGGTVEFAPGTYLSGTIELHSNITLNLQAGATILGSPNLKDYRAISRSSEGRSTALILAESAEHIAITGRGVIDGNGRAYIDRSKTLSLDVLRGIGDAPGTSLLRPQRGKP